MYWIEPLPGGNKAAQAGIWLQGRLAPFPAPNKIFISPFMVKKIEQGRKGAPSHTSKFLSLSNSRFPQFLIFRLHIYIYLLFYSTKRICGKKSSPSFYYTRNSCIYSAWTVLISANDRRIHNPLGCRIRFHVLCMWSCIRAPPVISQSGFVHISQTICPKNLLPPHALQNQQFVSCDLFKVAIC